MSKGYFIALPKGHDEKVYRTCIKIIKMVSGAATRYLLYNSRAVFLVIRPSETTTIRWGSSEESLRRLKEDPNFIELHAYLENV